MAKEDKLKALDAALGQIEKQFGKGSVMKLGDSGKNMNVQTVPTGSLSLDSALGLGGVPRGRIIEIYGPESSGKTTVALHGSRGTETWRDCRICGCRACTGSGLCKKYRSRY